MIILFDRKFVKFDLLLGECVLIIGVMHRLVREKSPLCSDAPTTGFNIYIHCTGNMANKMSRKIRPSPIFVLLVLLEIGPT